MKNWWENDIESIGYVPFNFGDNISVGDCIKDNEELQGLITANRFDCFEISFEGMFLHQAYHFLKDVDWSAYEERMNSVYFSYLETQTLQLTWCSFSLYCGQYEMVLRELRNMIESAFLFFRFDYESELRLKAGDDKLMKIEEVPLKETFGFPVFSKSGYLKWEDGYKKIYKALCYYTHTKTARDRTRKQHPEFNGMLPCVYDEDMICRCLYYMQQVLIMEIDMMKQLLMEVYEQDAGTYFDGIFDAILIPEP